MDPMGSTMTEITASLDDERQRSKPYSPKRQKTDYDRNDRNGADNPYRRRSPPSRGPHDGRSKPSGWSKKSDQNSRNSNQPGDNYNDGRRQHQRNRQRSASPGRRIPVDSEPDARKKKSARHRKQNPSTRIRSLRNLLERGGLPATVHAEKERELAGLLFDQQKDSVKNDAKKNLKRYHFIRFMERQKATRNLKKLRKMSDGENTSDDIKNLIHEAEVDLNYTLYSPLAQKYISLFARDGSEEGKPLPLSRNLSRMRKKDYATLSDEQRDQIEQYSLEAANTLQMSDGIDGAKPPLWYVVESKMEEGQKALEDFRDEKPKVAPKMDMVMGKGSESTADWMKDDGIIDPADLDTESDEDGGVGIQNKINDEDMSDGDGGFFERR